jgi:uncharacterized protein YkwD
LTANNNLKAFGLIVIAILLFALVSSPNQAQAKGDWLIAPSSVCPNQSNARGINNSQKVRAMLCMTNYARMNKGLRKYRLNGKLNWSARRKSADIRHCQQFSHNACRKDFSYWIQRSRYPRKCYFIGENIAWGSGGLSSVRSIFKAWMNSPPHRSAILEAEDFSDIGIGVVYGRFRGINNVAIWTQHFGKNC